MTFVREADFEEAVIQMLKDHGWEDAVLKNKTEKDLIQNWANILFENNRGIDQLNNIPLTLSEMDQILEQIRSLKTPLKLNGFINGETVSIKRDNPEDTLHFGKEVSLTIYKKREIAAGQSRYQIVQQPKFPTHSKLTSDRRGDLLLLINGMPVIHIELKRRKDQRAEAEYQIEKYSKEGVFSGLFSLVQVFVAMTPEDTVYFANPGPDGTFNENFYFHWEDSMNEVLNDWKDVIIGLLSIPMAHQMIGYYTVADSGDGVLKVMRSYQYYAANAISDQVSKKRWEDGNQRGGYIWHTTGSGKTMTSFKSAQLIANSNDADKVVFLTDRIELGTQSLKEYNAFASEREIVQATEDTYELKTRLKSDNVTDSLIVTSIQKMSRIKTDENGLNAYDIDKISSKRIVFIIDEAHRSTFGDMLYTIKQTFPRALFFGFTGTPIHEENQKKHNTTVSIFGNELHRYSIADGIRDHNVLGFDVYKIATFKDQDVRKAVALHKVKAISEEEVFKDEKKKEKYLKYMDSAIPMAKVELELPSSQYESAEHRKMVVEDIKNNWLRLSAGKKFHAIFATSSIPEAIEYYKLIRQMIPEMKITCLYDSSIDNKAGITIKEQETVKILKEYNELFDKEFSIPTYPAFKKDVSFRLAHKEYYRNVERTKQLDLLIVVDQMLTGYDSKWVNTLYLDKLLKYENIIQAFSRTNRLFGPDKQFGTIRYYRYPYTMEKNIEDAIKLYSGDKPFGLFVDNLKTNLKKMNEIEEEIHTLFIEENISDYTTLPKEKAVQAKFVSLFNQFNKHLEAAKIQGFSWDIQNYEFDENSVGATKAEPSHVKSAMTQEQYLSLLQRYKEVGKKEVDDPEDPGDLIPFELKGYLTEIDTARINAEYMNTRFKKYLKVLTQKDVSPEEVEQALQEVHKTFSTLSQDEQKCANLFLHDLQRGDIQLEPDKTLQDYIEEYMTNATYARIHRFARTFGLNEDKLRNMMARKLTENNINQYGMLDDLVSNYDKIKAKEYFENKEGKKIIPPKVKQKLYDFTKKFAISGGFDLENLDQN